MLYIKRFRNGKIMSYLRVYKTIKNKYSIQTKLYGSDIFEDNINFPFFETKEQAENYLENNYEPHSEDKYDED